jgi:protein-L-isoaspartate(D-aspartate) O-methyltransferase
MDARTEEPNVSAGSQGSWNRIEGPARNVVLSWLSLAAGCGAPADGGSADGGLEAARRAMVREQLAARDIRDPRVLAAMEKVPRDRFVSRELARYAYRDSPLPIGDGQTISQPYIVAFMTQALGLDGHEKVLEVGTGSGYQSAVLGECAREVYTIEIVSELAERARQLLEELGYANVHVRAGDGYAGWPDAAPFDAILVAAAPDHVPQPLVEELAVGGRMVLPVGKGTQELVLIEKTSQGILQRSLLPVQFVPMTGQATR